jgi:hypothetical protein
MRPPVVSVGDMGSPLAPNEPPEQLRQRAVALRAFAALIDGAAVCTLDRLTGSDTWIGPGPDECAADVRLIGIRLRARAVDLRTAARQLETQAAAVQFPAGTR